MTADARDFTGWTVPDWARAITPRIAGALLDPLSLDSIELVSGDGYTVERAAPRVLGYRLFIVDSDGILSSIGVGGSWDDAKQTAECRRSPGTWAQPHADKAPASGCACGLYGFYNVQNAIDQNDVAGGGTGGMVFAACAYTGTIIGHRYGLRAEFSEIIGLSTDGYGRHRRSYLEMARDRYGLAADSVRDDPHDLAKWASALPGWIKVQ